MGVRGRPTKWDAWYSKPRWARIRRHQLLEHPLCTFCLERGIVEPATICDHVEPHHGEVNKFWLGPFQSLCKSYHDSTKRFAFGNGKYLGGDGPLTPSGLPYECCRVRAVGVRPGDGSPHPAVR